MVTVEQVPAWGVMAGVGHAVTGGERHEGGWGWCSTACGSVFGWLDGSKEQPKRVCRQCRKNLKTMTLVTDQTKLLEQK
jgi:hypothetical protein